MEQFSRREFLRMSALAAAGVAAVACAKTEAPSVEEPKVEDKATTAPKVEEPSKPSEKESPMLVEMVGSGKLPALEERIPQDPMTIGPGVLITEEFLPDWEPGTYGGTMRFCTATTHVAAELYDANAEQPLIAPGRLTAASPDIVKPSLLTGFEVGDGQKSITWHMRKGLKWSDGEPATTGDVKFYFEDVAFDPEISPTPSRDYKSRRQASGDLMTLEIIDDYTFKTTFTEPGLHLVSRWSGYSSNYHSFMRPAHYLKQFHKKYADKAEYAKLLEEAKLTESEWFNYYNQRDETRLTWTNILSLDPEVPRVSAWMLENVGTGVTTWTRNPYYHKVDTEGKQLPYIDKERIEFVANSEAVTMKILAGEVDWGREYASMVSYPLYKENEEKGGFKVNITQMHVAPIQFSFNFTHPDENWRNTVRDVRFRKALNMAIDHEKIVEAVYQGFGTPPTEITGLSYDPEGAAALLDEMGMDQKDADGWRIGLDGKTFVFPLEVSQGYTPEQDSVCELLIEYWADIGIKTDFKNVEGSLYGTRNTNNDLYGRMQWAHTSFWRNAPLSSDFTPGSSRLWQQWSDSAGEEGEEPEAWAKRLYEIASAADAFVLSGDEVAEIHQEMWDILKAQVPFILPIDNAVYPLLGSARLGNVPTSGWAIVASFTQEQFFFKE